jgi:BirA family biotin operon repressor/biotin-[acetyl-CoA-carboxylase] ligase
MVNPTSSPKAHILSRLRASGDPVSGSYLADELGMSRVAVWKHLEALRQAGYDLVADREGYRLASEGDFLRPWEFPNRESRIVSYERTDSTMDRALELGLAEPRCGAIVVADSQTSGRGRWRRRWNSSKGGLFATLVLRPSIAPWRADRAAMAGGVALCEALRDLTGERFSLEWPNDVYLAGRKAAGLLVEYLAEGEELRFLDLGIGVNVANRAPGESAISLRDLPGPTPTRRGLLAAFLDRFESIDLEWPGLADAWNALSSSRGKTVESYDGELLPGRAEGMDDEGRLVVSLADGRHAAFRPSEAHIA